MFNTFQEFCVSVLIIKFNSKVNWLGVGGAQQKYTQTTNANSRGDLDLISFN